jgi:hypothetical protein
MQDDTDRNPDPHFDLPAISWENPRKRQRYIPMTEEEAELIQEEKQRRRREKAEKFQEDLADTVSQSIVQSRREANLGRVNEEAQVWSVHQKWHSRSREYKYTDFRVKGQHYCPMDRNNSIAYQMLQQVTRGVASVNRDSDFLTMKSAIVNLVVQLPERSVHELEASVLDDDLQFYAILDRFPQQGPPEYNKILTVHDKDSILAAFPNPAYSSRFLFLHSEQFNMRYETLWEYTRVDADKKSVCLGVMQKRTIELPVDGVTVHFIPGHSGYSSLLYNNLIFCFITGKGVSVSSGLLSEVKEMKTFNIDWNMRITHY